MADNKKATIWTRDFICVLFTNGLLVLSNNSVNTLVSTYTTWLGVGPKLMGLLTGLFFGVALAMRPVAGPVTTRVDNRKLMIGVYALGCIVNLGYALFRTVPMFLLLRITHGFQYAFVGSLGLTIASRSLPKEKMSSGIGIYGASSAVATAVAPQIGLWLKDLGTAISGTELGFVFVFLFGSVTLGAGLIPSFLMTPQPKDKATVERAGKWYQTIISGPPLIPTAIIMLMLLSYSLFNAYIVPYGEELSLGDVGLFFIVQSAVLLVSRPLFGGLSDRLGPKKIFVPGMLVLGASFLVIGTAKGMPMLLVGAVMTGLGYGAANPTMQSVVMQTEPSERGAVASNTMFVGNDIGLFVGPFIGGVIREIAPYRVVMLYGIIPVMLSLLLFLLTWRRTARRLEEVRRMEADRVKA